jgi:hypothetical protein
MKKLLLLTFLSASLMGYAQDTTSAKEDTVKPDPNWKIENIAKIQANQAQFKNWQSGGINSVSWTAYMDLSADYSKNGWSWENDLQLGYGQQFQDDTDWRKTDDIINYVTQVGRSLDSNDIWSLIANASFRSQFTSGFEYPNDSIRTSNWLAPGYINAGLGFQYQPKKYVQFLFTPVSTKITIVNDQRLANLGTYGNDAAELDTAGNVITEGKKVRAEFGGTIGVKFEKELFKNVNYKSNLGLFSNYLENPQNIDLVWNNLITFKVNELINFTFTLDMIYDDDIKITEYNSDGSIKGVGPRLQIKQLLGFGINYTLRNFTPKG